eukprot:2155786-Prymnesium_polylepis.1
MRRSRRSRRRQYRSLPSARARMRRAAAQDTCRRSPRASLTRWRRSARAAATCNSAAARARAARPALALTPLTRGARGRSWVPHYSVHKTLAGLLAIHRELRVPGALDLALGMGAYLWRRAAATRAARGRAGWA